MKLKYKQWPAVMVRHFFIDIRVEITVIFAKQAVFFDKHLHRQKKIPIFAPALRIVGNAGVRPMNVKTLRARQCFGAVHPLGWPLLFYKKTA